eukprot:Selendium_serpulae@DN6261_c5_g1_i3.p3
MLFKVSNANLPDVQTHCGVLEFTATEGCCVLPEWLHRRLCLEEGDHVLVTNVSLSKGSYVKLRPCSVKFLDLYNPRVVIFAHHRGSTGSRGACGGHVRSMRSWCRKERFPDWSERDE